MRRSSIFICALIVFIAGAVIAAQDQQVQQNLAALETIQGKFSFVVIGDNRSGDDSYRKIVSVIVEKKPDFVINTGDLIPTPGDKKAWATFWELSKPITMPYFLAVGNHDVNAKVPGSEKIYKAEVDLPGNELYYSFNAGNSLFIVLDSSIADKEKRIIGEQYQWLEGVLANSRQRHTFVFLHHPLYTDPRKGHHRADSLDRYPETRDQLEALFARYKVTAVFAGHEHYYERRLVDGILHVITGGGGAPLYEKEEQGGFYHGILVTVDGDSVSCQVVDSNGKIRDKF